MAFELIDRLVSGGGFSFQAWDDRYSKGVWAALGTYEEEIDTVRDLSSAGDLDMMPATEYILASDWMPYVVGLSLFDAMQTLEKRLTTLPPEQLCRDSAWAQLTHDAVARLREEYRGAKDYGALDGRLPALPQTFAEALAGFQREAAGSG